MKKIFMMIIMLIFSISCFANSKYTYISSEKQYISIMNESNDAIVIYGTTWCPNCKEYLEELIKIKPELRENVKIYLIEFPYSVKEGKLTAYEKETLKYLDEVNYPFDIYIDKEKMVFDKYEIEEIPSVAYIKNGKRINNLEPRDFKREEILKLFGK